MNNEYVESSEIAQMSMLTDITCDICKKIFGKALLHSRDIIYFKPRCGECLVKYPFKIVHRPRY